MPVRRYHPGVAWGPPAARWKRSAFRWVAAHRRTGAVRSAARVASAFLAAYDNDNGDFRFDGELDLLRRLATYQPRVVIDVGAHHGEWTLAAAGALPSATIYAVEPAPPNLRVLTARVAGRPAVQVVDCALGATAAKATLLFDEEHSSMASLVPAAGAGGMAGAGRFEVAVATGDQLLENNGIAAVDFLKIDAEGWDLDVLRGFGGAVRDGRVRAVQFELSPWNAVVGVWLRDFLDVLRPAGFIFGRIFPGYVERMDYHPGHEDFRYRGNVLAVRADDPMAALVDGAGGR